MQTRRQEADQFYRSITPARYRGRGLCDPPVHGRDVVEQTVFWPDVQSGSAEHGGRSVRNGEWFHMVNKDILSMPDKREYPWYAAWDLAFHAVAPPGGYGSGQGPARPAAAEAYLHPTGQIPAYEWNFSDVNPPVHAWATIFLYELSRR